MRKETRDCHVGTVQQDTCEREYNRVVQWVQELLCDPDTQVRRRVPVGERECTYVEKKFES